MIRLSIFNHRAYFRVFNSGYFRPHHRRRLVQVVRQIADALHPLDVQSRAGPEGDSEEGRSERLPVLLRHLQVLLKCL